MPNPLWTKGMESPNKGRTKQKRRSGPAVTKMLERFVTRQLTLKKMQTLYNKLQPKDQATFLCDLLPYIESKKPTSHAVGISNLSPAQVDELFDRVMSGTLEQAITGPLLADIQEAEIISTNGHKE